MSCKHEEGCECIEDIGKASTAELIEELESRGEWPDNDETYHDDCIESVSDIETNELVSELDDRGMLAIERIDLEYAYEALLRGNLTEAKRRMNALLLPNGGCDTVAHRVGQDMKAAESLAA
jgi:hypothetical protein